MSKRIINRLKAAFDDMLNRNYNTTIFFDPSTNIEKIFSITFTEYEKTLLREIISSHSCSKEAVYKIIQTPSGIGTGLTFKCSCGFEKDFTEYTSW